VSIRQSYKPQSKEKSEGLLFKGQLQSPSNCSLVFSSKNEPTAEFEKLFSSQPFGGVQLPS